MKRINILLFCSLFFLQCGSIKPEHDQTILALQLCELYGSDQSIRSKTFAQKNSKLLPLLDSINFSKVVSFVQTYGMPNETLLGTANYHVECVKLAAFSILLHNPDKLVLDETYYALFLNEVQAGRMKPEFFALLLDKYYWSRGENLVYGSQFGLPCLSEKATVNQRRKAIGLEELADSKFKVCE
ncbi:hypothetical protein ACPDHL_09115 [Myroides sp. C15-4]|uniref:hypothetical protein n=1 Tax=Myroides sp. C15-4 TaxID=3400532 RepID=UPI003D2F583E